MVEAVTVKGLKEFGDKISRFKVELPKALEKDASTFMKQNLKIAAMDLRWMGILQSSIRYEKIATGRYNLLMRDYGVMIDRMSPHWVAPHGKPVLEQWAEEHLGFIPHLMYVRPHPWIVQGMANARKELKETFGNGHTIRLIRRKGK